MIEDQYVLFSVFRLPVTAYALCLSLSLAAALAVFFRRCVREGVDGNAAWRTALLALPLGLIGARVFYCAARYKLYNEIGFGSALALWNGGYALWGAVGGAALAAVIAARRSRVRPARVLDAMAPAGALAIGLMRFAEYFSGEGRGRLVENEAFQRFPFAVYSEAYEEWYLAVFILEGLAALAIFAALLRARRAPGDKARMLLILYSACQMLLESLREDSCLKWLFVRVSQLTAALVLAGLMIAAAVKWARKGHNGGISKGRMAAYGGLFLLGVCVIIAMEFAVDGKILAGLPEWADYLIIALSCAVMGRAGWRTVLRSPAETIDKNGAELLK